MNYGKLKSGLLNFRMLFFVFFFLLGIFLRLYKYPFFPTAGNAEENLYVWSGLSLIEEGVPISWNDLPPYKSEHIIYEGFAPNYSGREDLPIRLLKPWLDEPPLFSLIEGAISKFYGQENFTIISPYIIRIPPLIFSFISMFLVFLLSKKLFGWWMGNLSLALYATIPTIVFGSRLAVAETPIATIFLGITLLLISYFKSKDKKLIYLAYFLTLIAAFMKPTGLLLAPYLSFWLMKNKEIKNGIKYGLITIVIFFVLYFAYGFHYDKELFLDVLIYQSQRPAGWSGISHLFISPGFNIEIFKDNFIIIGFLSMIFLMFSKRKFAQEIILFNFIYAIMIVLVSGGRGDQLGWYRYPIYPFLAISLALLIENIYKKPNFYKFAIFLPLIMGNGDLLQNPFWKIDFFWKVKFFRYLFALFLAPMIAYEIFKKKYFISLGRYILILTLCIGLIYNILVVINMFSLTCDHSLICPLPYKVDLLEPFK